MKYQALFSRKNYLHANVLKFNQPFLAHLDKVQEELLHYPCISIGIDTMLKFTVKVFKTSYFPNCMMDLVYI